MILVVCGCAATVYTVPDFAERTASHQTVAIIPFDVSIDLQELPDGVTQEDLRAQEQEEAYISATDLYAIPTTVRTNEVNVSISLHDRTDSALLWNFDHEVGGGLGSSPEGLAESLMLGIARKFP